MKKTINLIESDDESGDLILPITDDLMKLLDWKEGDILNLDVKDGNIFIKKKEEQ